MIKKILKNAHRYVFWAVLSAVFWMWILMLCTEAPPKHKVMLYADLEGLDKAAMSETLSEDLPRGIRYVEVERFTDQIFSPNAVLSGDLFLIPESNAEAYFGSFVKIDREAFKGCAFYEHDGEAYGVCVYDPAEGIAIAGRYIDWSALLGEERCYLFFGRESKHLGAWNGAQDDAAIRIAQRLTELN